MSKKESNHYYKKLRKKLNKDFVNNQRGEYDMIEGVNDWLVQSGLKPKLEYRIVLFVINNGKMIYPFQKEDRKKIFKYFKKNKTFLK
jgi:hypothetical protein